MDNQYGGQPNDLATSHSVFGLKINLPNNYINPVLTIATSSSPISNDVEFQKSLELSHLDYR